MRRERKPNTITKKVKGRVYHYYRMTYMKDGRRREKLIRIDAAPGTPEFDQIYWGIRSGKTAGPPKTSFEALIQSYLASPKYLKLSDGTKRKYRPIIEDIRTKSGSLDVTRVTSEAVMKIQAKYAATPRAADWRVQVLSVLFTHAIKRLKWMTTNPATGVELFGSQRQFEPWPEKLVDKLAEAPERVRTAAELILGTGQRPNAAIRMEWADFDGEWMQVFDEKGGERFEIYAPQSLRDYLATVPKAGRYVLAKNLTQPLGYNAVEHAFRSWRETLGGWAQQYSLHGLRKLAIVRLAEAGCSDAEIQAVTRQSAQTVAYYRARANRRILSKNAQRRREE